MEYMILLVLDIDVVVTAIRHCQKRSHKPFCYLTKTCSLRRQKEDLSSGIHVDRL